MNRTAVPSIVADLRALLVLAVPIVLVQVGLMLMGVVDAIFVGHVSATELAGAALGNLYFFAIAMFGMGLLMALDPVISQAIGAREPDAVARGLQRGVLLAAGLSVPSAALCLFADPVLRLLGQPEDVVPRAAAFARFSAPGILPFLLFVVLRLSLQAMKHTRAIMVTILIANLLNAGFNWVFVYGHLGAPPMGAAGSALSSTLGRWVMAPLLLALAWRELRPYLVPWQRDTLQAAPLRRMLALGLPIAGQFSLEIGAFSVIALLAGRFGAEAMAGHQLAINFASLTFMVPLGVGSASAVLVGHAIGEGDVRHVRRLAGTGLLVGAAFMAVCAAVMLFAPGPIARVYTNVAGVIAVAAALIPIAGVFQIFDGLQVVATGILRGTGDKRGPLLINVLGFWLVGMPVSLWMGFQQKLGVVGLWWGFVAGLAAVAVCLVLRLRWRLAGVLERVRVETVQAGGAAAVPSDS